jgi:subtilase family serine protease
MSRPLGASLVLLVLAATMLPVAASASPGASEKTVEILFELRHPGGLDRFVRAVSDPASANYRGYASVEQLVQRFGASSADQNSTLAWLAARGLHGSVGPTGTYVTAALAPARAERLLGRVGGARASASAAGPGRPVPAGLRGPVTSVGILGNRDSAVKNVASASPDMRLAAGDAEYSSILPHSGTAAGCAAGRTGPGAPLAAPFTPNQYLDAYGIDSMHDRGFQGQGQTVALVEVDGFHHTDVETFDRCFGAGTPPIRVTPVTPITKPYTSGTETTLDLEVLSVGAPRLHRIDVYEGLGTEAGIMLSAGTALGSKGHHPDVISVSLGICEPMYSGHLVYRRAMDNIFAVAAGAGISTLVAAGDTGSSGCRINAKNGTTALPLRTVSLPSSSPYVTAVGGTNLRLNAANGIRSEIVWNDWPDLAGGGGGGVSLLSPRRPWWQQVPALRRFGTGRIVPDIAALADVFPGYAYFCTSPECAELPQFANRGWTSIGGTSAATPLMASAAALADQFAERQRQRNLGFLNPLLYRLGAAASARHRVFRDVTRGNNDLGALLPENVGGGHPLGCCGARPGYDWASGWGSLKVVGLAKAAFRAAP